MAEGRQGVGQCFRGLHRRGALLPGAHQCPGGLAVDGRLKVTLQDHDTDPGCIADVLVKGGARLIGLEEDELGLEEVFLRVTRGETQ